MLRETVCVCVLLRVLLVTVKVLDRDEKHGYEEGEAHL